MNLLTTLALLQLQSGQIEAFESTLKTALTAVVESLPAWLGGAGFPQTEDARGKLGALLRRPDQRWSLN